MSANCLISRFAAKPQEKYFWRKIERKKENSKIKRTMVWGSRNFADLSLWKTADSSYT